MSNYYPAPGQQDDDSNPHENIIDDRENTGAGNNRQEGSRIITQTKKFKFHHPTQCPFCLRVVNYCNAK